MLIGEFAVRDEDGADGRAYTWFDTFLSYMSTDYSWTYWSLNPNSHDTGGILQDDWESVHTWKVDALRPFMAPMIGVSN